MNQAHRRILRVLPTTLLLGGCSAVVRRSPTVDILGSYFPAWIVSTFIGLIITIFIRLLLVGMRLDDYIGPRGVVYPCLLICCTLLIWLLFYGV